MFNKLKQFKDLRDKAKTIQTELAKEKVEGSAAWGKVKIGMDGNQAVTSVDIDQEMMSDREKLQSALKDAFTDAVRKAQQKMVAKMKETGGLDIPGMN
jgi:DNA-binding YbaB/EbfC family protein